MFSLKIEWKKVVGMYRYLLALIILLGAGYVGYLAYFFATNLPKEVRVTNVTGSSATISWYTENKDKGIVAIKEKNSFLPLINNVGSVIAYDDRDVANAQKELADRLAKEALQSLDGNDEVSVDVQTLSTLKITKKGRYYVHHVTINNLAQETKYFFRVGNGLFWWNIKADNQTKLDFEAPTVSEFSFSTYKDPENIKVPDSSYGKVYSIVKNKDDFVISNPSTDSIVFLKGVKVDGNTSSQYLSSLTNTDGGWIIDKSGLRNEKGEIDSTYTKLKDKLFVYAQFENVQPKEEKELVWGENDAPALDIIGNDETELKTQGNIIDVIRNLFIKKSEELGLKINNIASFKTLAAQGDCPNGYEKVIDQGLTRCVPKTIAPGGACPSGTVKDSDSGQCVIAPSDSKNQKILCKYTTASGAKGSQYVSNQAECEKLQAKKSSDDGGKIATVHECKEKIPNTDKYYYTEDDSEWNETLQACVKKNVPYGDSYDGCTGRYSRTCDDKPISGNTTNCFCMSKKGNYLPLRGTTCRPVGCANNNNEDYNCTDDGVCALRSKCSDGSDKCDSDKKILCGKNDYTSPGCAISEKCPEGYTFQSSNKSCVLNGTSQPTAPGVPTTPSDNGGSTSSLIACVYLEKDKLIKEELTSAQCAKKSGKFVDKSGNNEIVLCKYQGNGDSVVTEVLTKDECNSHSGVYKQEQSMMVRIEEGEVVVPLQQTPVPIPALTPPLTSANSCTTSKEYSGMAFDCGYGWSNDWSTGGDLGRKYCGSNEGKCAGNNQICQIIADNGANNAGICVDKGATLGVSYGTFSDGVKVVPEKYNGDEMTYDCFVSVETGKPLKYRVEPNYISTPKVEGKWTQVAISYCNDLVKSDLQNNTNKKGLENFIIPVSAKDTNVDVVTEGAFIIFPESGLYDVTIGENSFRNIKVNKDNNYFFFVERNGVDGYQQPANPQSPQPNEDLMLNAKGAVVNIATQAKNFKLNINNGINLVSFNFLPSLETNKALSAIDFLKYVNAAGRKVKRITSFDSGMWNGGVGYVDDNSTEIVGNDFDLLPGKAFAIVGQKDAAIDVPGFAIKNSIPVALSSGWNLIGVNGYQKTYTANSLIDSINGMVGITSDNVTWWPTSKGRYESFQKSEGIEYGFDFPILKNQGYFVRIKSFTPESLNARSLIWNPESDLHGQPGSN